MKDVVDLSKSDFAGTGPSALGVFIRCASCVRMRIRGCCGPPSSIARAHAAFARVRSCVVVYNLHAEWRPKIKSAERRRRAAAARRTRALCAHARLLWTMDKFLEVLQAEA
eukprot:scaffold127841_cov28-Tisochrysis_lutea.AAC.3